MTRIFAVSGYKNSGKTTLCMTMLNELQKLGIRTGYIKRTSESVEPDAGTDTAKANALGVRAALWGGTGLCVTQRGSDFSAFGIASSYFPDAEIILLEGGKHLDLPKIWVENGEPHNDVNGVFMTYDRRSRGSGPLVWGAGSEHEMALRLASTVRGKFYRSSAVFIDDKPLPMKDFIADFIKGSVLGMLASLKGGNDPGGVIRIYIDKKK